MAGFLRYLLRRGRTFPLLKRPLIWTTPLSCAHIVKTYIWTAAILIPKDNTDHQSNNIEWSKERDIMMNISLAIEAINKENFTLAEKYLQAALKVSNDISTVGVTCVYDMLATLAFKRGDAEKTVSILNELLQKLPHYDDNYIHFNIKLAQLHDRLCNHEFAEEHFKKCISVQRMKMCTKESQDTDIILLTSALFWYGKFLASRGRHREAKAKFEEAYLSSSLTKSINLRQVMVIMYSIGDSALALGEKETALNHFLNSIVIGKSLDHQDLPLCYNKVGHILMLKGKLSEAQSWFNNAKEAAHKYKNKELVNESQSLLEKVEKLKSPTP